MSIEKRIADTAQNVQKKVAPAPPPLILGIFFLLLIIIAGVIGGLIFFGVIDIDGTASPEPTSTPFNVLNPIAEFDECGAILETNPQLFCNLVEVESDSTWTNSLPTPVELIDMEMIFGSVGIPGANWISPVNFDRPIEKVFYLPEGEIDFAEVRVTIGATYPLASISINGEVFEEGENFTYDEDTIPSALGIIFQRPLPENSTPPRREINLRQFLHSGRNVIQFQFAEEGALATPEVTINPEVTVDPNATPIPPPIYALIAQLRIPVTGIYNSVQSEVYFSDADWQDAPNVGVYPTATSDVLGDAQWIQGIDRPVEGQETVSVERVFYLAETAPNYALTVDVRNGTLAQIRIENAAGESREILLPPAVTTEEGGFSFQRYAAIPLSSGFDVGLNRLVVSYAPNSNVEHYVRVRMASSAGETILLSDADWMRGEYRAISETNAESVLLTSPTRRGTAHLRGFVATPNSSVSGNVIITCLQTDGRIPCSTVRLRHNNEIYGFGAENSITLVQPERLFSLDLSFQADSALEDFATLRLGMVYVDATGASQNISAGSVWYAYRPASVITSANTAWAVVEDAAFIFSANDGNEGEYISVFETTLTLPQNTVVIEAESLGSADDHLLAIYINGHQTYQGNLLSEDFRQVTSFPIDAALLREGENRIVVHSLNRFGGGALAMRFGISYFTQAKP